MWCNGARTSERRQGSACAGERERARRGGGREPAHRGARAQVSASVQAGEDHIDKQQCTQKEHSSDTLPKYSVTLPKYSATLPSIMQPYQIIVQPLCFASIVCFGLEGGGGATGRGILWRKTRGTQTIELLKGNCVLY
jgi:hypothetical protein